MSRSGYSDDCDNLELWRGAVMRATYGKRGQALLRDMLAVLDAMPAKRLIAGELVTPEGECCALGAVALARQMDISDVDALERDQVAQVFSIAPALAAEIVYVNDEEADWRKPGESPEERWTRVRAWVAAQIKGEP